MSAYAGNGTVRWRYHSGGADLWPRTVDSFTLISQILMVLDGTANPIARCRSAKAGRGERISLHQVSPILWCFPVPVVPCTLSNCTIACKTGVTFCTHIKSSDQ